MSHDVQLLQNHKAKDKDIETGVSIYRFTEKVAAKVHGFCILPTGCCGHRVRAAGAVRSWVPRGANRKTVELCSYLIGFSVDRSAKYRASSMLIHTAGIQGPLALKAFITWRDASARCVSQC